MKDFMLKLKELFSRLVDCFHRRENTEEMTQKDLDELYQMLEDYKKRNSH